MDGKEIKTHNKSDRPDNIVKKENEIYQECEEIEAELPRYLKGFFIYLRGNVLPMTRQAYLHDIRFFFSYLIAETDLTSAAETKDITLEELQAVKATDINYFLDYCRKYKVELNGETYYYENSNKTLARKKSSLSVFFKELYRDGLMPKNITEGFDPIRVQKAGEHEIKALQDDEVMIMLCGAVYKSLGYKVFPEPRDKRSDIIQAVCLGSADAVVAFCEGIQAAAPIDSYVTPVPWAMPGYESEVVMAAGAFVQGSSIELSADAPIREPYNVYFQGGLTYEHSKFGVLKSVNRLYEKGLLNL